MLPFLSASGAEPRGWLPATGDRRPSWRGLAWLLPAGVGLVLLAAYYLVPSQPIQAAVFATSQGLFAAGVAVGIRLHRPRLAGAWWAIAGGLALVAVATALLVGGMHDLHLLPGLSAVDAIDLTGDLLIVVGVLVLMERSLGGGARGSLLDAGVLTVAASLLAWVFWMDPMTEVSGDQSHLAVALAHPAIDVLWFGLVARLLLARGHRSPAFWLLAAALPCAFVGDVAFVVGRATGGFDAGGVTDVGWWLFTAGFAMAGLHPTMVEPIRPLGPIEDRPSRVRLALLLVALLLVPAVISLQIATDPEDVDILGVAVAAAALMAILVVLRLGVILEALRRTLDAERSVRGELTHRALHDSLTGLPNRTQFLARLDTALADDQRFCVLFCDLDDFKLVNDTLGHGVGDELLVALATRLARLIRPTDMAARLGGDEFAVFIANVDGREANRIADRGLAAVRTPVSVGGRDLTVGASVGIAASGSGADAEALMRNADIAMYLAKADGKGQARVFHPEMHEDLVGRLAMRSDLEAAIAGGQLLLEYQPVVSLESSRIESVEALVRWRHPTRGLLPPIEFIPIAEATRLIVPLGRWILTEACRQAAAWTTKPGGNVSMAVNVSARQLREPVFVELVEEVLQETGLDPARLVLELTESVLTDATITETVLARLRALGVRIAIDDFGTGYSSLSYVQRYPVDILKIDRSFVSGLGDGAKEVTVTKAILGLARQLGLRTVAEGVEEADQLARLRRLGCDMGQGFLFARPQSARVIEALLAGDPVAEGDPSPAVAPAKARSEAPA